MINRALFRREMKISARLLLIFASVITLYVVCIITLYNPITMKMLDGFASAMPEIMASVGMTPGSSDLLGFLITYLYGFILLIFPMIYSILRSCGLAVKYTENGSMVYLAAAPVKRRTIALTQMSVLLSGITILILYTTILEILFSGIRFPGELDISGLLAVNTGLLFLHFLIGGICFCASCIFSEVRRSALFGAGIPALMYLFQMLANTGSRFAWLRYFSVFTLFDPDNLASGCPDALIKAGILLTGAFILYAAAVSSFCRKDLQI